jgi:hypothetical protein
MFQTKVLEKITTPFLCSIIFFQKQCRFLDNVVKYGGTLETIWVTIRHMRFACWIPGATNTLTECVTLFFFTPQM